MGGLDKRKGRGDNILIVKQKLFRGFPHLFVVECGNNTLNIEPHY